jgi:hypothetical protein
VNFGGAIPTACRSTAFGWTPPRRRPTPSAGSAPVCRPCRRIGKRGASGPFVRKARKDGRRRAICWYCFLIDQPWMIIALILYNLRMLWGQWYHCYRSGPIITVARSAELNTTVVLLCNNILSRHRMEFQSVYELPNIHVRKSLCCNLFWAIST